MSKISQETMNSIQSQAVTILNKYGTGSIYFKPGKKDQLQFLYDDENGVKRRKALSIPEGTDLQQIKLQFITEILVKRYEIQQDQQKKQLLGELINKELLEKVERIADALPESEKLQNPVQRSSIKY